MNEQKEMKKEAYRERMEAKLQELDANISVPEAKAESVSADAKIQYADKIEDLRGRKQGVHGKLDELKDSTQEAWQEMRKGIDEARGELVEGVDYA